MAHGVDGFVDITAPIDEVATALESAVTGWSDGDAGSEPVVGSSQVARLDLMAGDVGLSEREHQVLGLIAQGCTNREIAEQLFIGVNTVKTNIRSIYSKIGATNRATAVA
ncbi:MULTISPECIES: LuxR C-terminal-related transcriptional regulator [unclassified Nocardioides]|uniref:LuxR C-terminal-related transcriptional regulator n=1 Tax=unclassified Nocardioides TaxID=2615069 RepID=UPI00301533CB